MLTIGFLGGGNMAGALIGGLLAGGPRSDLKVHVTDLHEDKLARLAALGAQTHSDVGEWAASCDLMVFAVKPQGMKTALASLMPFLNPDGAALTIAAGIEAAAYADWLNGYPLMRAMPNTPAMVGMGVSGLWIPAGISETAANAARQALAAAGKNVLLIDLDSQASLTISVGMEPLEVPKTIVDVLKKDGAPICECVQKINDRLHIVTSIIDLAPMEMEMLSRASREKILDRALKPIKDSYDYILIDCPPQLSILTINALSCADGVLIPVKTDYLAYRGLTQLQDSIREIQELINPDLKVLGVIATLYDARVSDDKDILALLKEEYNLVGVVKRLAVAKKGIYDGLAVVEQAPTSEIAKEYTAIAKMIINGNFDREDIENG